MDYVFNEDYNEVDYEDENESNEDIKEQEQVQQQERNQFKANNEKEEMNMLASSSSNAYSLSNSSNINNLNIIHQSLDIDNNINSTKISSNNEIIQKAEVLNSVKEEEKESNISENEIKNNNYIFNNNKIIEQKSIENIAYKNILKFIINNNKMTNSIIISENISFINYITDSVINLALLQNKKICYLTSDTKKAESIYELYKTNQNLKSILFQKGKKKKNKNDLNSFLEQLDQNNLIIILPNILYKLLSIGFVKLSDFGLIIFDECQLSDSNHPYNIIMQEFFFYYYKFPSEKVNKNTLPNIFGITNSPFKEKGIIKNKKKGEEILKNISENLDCQIVLDPNLFEEEKNNEENVEFIEVKNIIEQKNKIDGINILLMKYFFEPMLDFCLDNYLQTNGNKKELNQNNYKDISIKYISVLKEKFSKTNLEEYNNIETAERSIHFLSQNSVMFKTFEDIQKTLINIIQNADLKEIYILFEKYKEIYEINLEKAEESNDDINFILYKKLINLFLINMKAFKCLINKNIEYKTDRLNKFLNKLNEIYTKNKNSKIFVCVNNRKMVYILNSYLNRDLPENKNYRNKIGYIVGANNKKEENITLTLSIRSTTYEINERKKEYNENKINILICTPPALDYLANERCDNILVFSEMPNGNNDLDKIKEKAKNCKAKLYLFIDQSKLNNINQKKSSKKQKEKNDSTTQLKNYFLDKDRNVKNPKNFRTKCYIDKKDLEKNLYYHIENTEAKVTLKNCMLLFNEINNIFFSKNIKIEINKKIIEYNSELKFACQSEFICRNDRASFTSNKYNDKQSAENECYMRYIIYLHKRGEIDDNLKVKM